MGLLGGFLGGPGASARGWRPEQGGSSTGWVEALAVENEALGRSQGGLTSKIHLAVDSRGLPVSILLTAGQAGDNPELLPLLDQVSVRLRWGGQPRKRPRLVIADKTYSHPVTRRALRARRIVHLPGTFRPDRPPTAKGPAGGRSPTFDPETYKQRNVVERCFGRLKQFRGLATRDAKRATYYRAEVVTLNPAGSGGGFNP